MNVYVVNNYQDSLIFLEEQIIKLKKLFVMNVMNILKVLNLLYSEDIKYIVFYNSNM